LSAPHDEDEHEDEDEGTASILAHEAGVLQSVCVKQIGGVTAENRFRHFRVFDLDLLT